MIELGCGDGNQLRLTKYPSYLGLDVSQTAVARCKELFAGDGAKDFLLLDEYEGQTATIVDVTLELRSKGLLSSIFFPVVSRAIGGGLPNQVGAMAPQLSA